MFTLMMIIVNTAFWFALHFGVAWLFVLIPENVGRSLFDSKRRFFCVSEGEMKFYRFIRLPKWKDKLPQYNVDFDKRHLGKTLSEEYLGEFIFITCRAEIIHLAILLLGYLSVLFCLFCDDKAGNFPIFFIIATVIGLANIPFCLIHRYNRFRMTELLSKLEAKKKLRREFCPDKDFASTSCFFT